MKYKIVAIPLNRKAPVSFLKDPSHITRGAAIRVLGQRPSVASEIEWAERLGKIPSVEELLWRDRPGNLITQTTTDRLIPVEHILNDENYLTRNLGGWSPVYFGLIEADSTNWSTDPLLSEAVELTSYDNNIRSLGADAGLVESRLGKEFGTNNINEISMAIVELHKWRLSHHFVRSAIDMMKYADLLYGSLNKGDDISGGETNHRSVPKVLLIDELLGQHVRIELARREFIANGNEKAAKEISGWQNNCQSDCGLSLIFKGEYVMGRQRKSTVLIAEELGIVAKQPGAEPFHEAELDAKTYNGSSENWPVLTKNGEIVTPCGRMRLIIEQGLVIQLNHIFNHNVKCICSLGFIIEPYVTGPTLQDYLLENPMKLTPELYSFVLLHQLICEELEVENGDWHSANFIVLDDQPNTFMDGAPQMVHIDWGAARPLTKDETTADQRKKRLNQVKNIAFSFHDEHIASAIIQIHDDITSNIERMSDLRKLSEKILNA